MPFYEVEVERVQRITYKRTVLAHDEAEAIAIAAEPTAHPSSYDDDYGEVLERFPPRAKLATSAAGATIPHEYVLYSWKCPVCHGSKFQPWCVPHDKPSERRLCDFEGHGDPLKDPPPTDEEHAVDAAELNRSYREMVGEISTDDEYTDPTESG